MTTVNLGLPCSQVISQVWTGSVHRVPTVIDEKEPHAKQAGMEPEQATAMGKAAVFHAESRPDSPMGPSISIPKITSLSVRKAS